ncbi:MAG: GNAT family N-acetyltransferase [Candidatus Fimadaptatus sp.]
MPRMLGERIMLREFEQNDLGEMRKWITDPDSTRYLSDTFVVPQTWEQTAGFLDSLLSGSKPGVHLVIADIMTGDYLGQCDLMNVTDYSRKAELAIVLGPEHQGKGYGGEAIALLLELAFCHLNLNRVHLRVSSQNARALICYERAGFAREGVLRQDSFSGGEYRDTVIMGILRDEWLRTHKRPAT